MKTISRTYLESWFYFEIWPNSILFFITEIWPNSNLCISNHPPVIKGRGSGGNKGKWWRCFRKKHKGELIRGPTNTRKIIYQSQRQPCRSAILFIRRKVPERIPDVSANASFFQDEKQLTMGKVDAFYDGLHSPFGLVARWTPWFHFRSQQWSSWKISGFLLHVIACK